MRWVHRVGKLPKPRNKVVKEGAVTQIGLGHFTRGAVEDRTAVNRLSQAAQATLAT